MTRPDRHSDAELSALVAEKRYFGSEGVVFKIDRHGNALPYIGVCPTPNRVKQTVAALNLYEAAKRREVVVKEVSDDS